MIAVIGDIHGDFKQLNSLVNQAAVKGATAVIQVGDFGVYPSTLKDLFEVSFALPVYFIDGNHEHFEVLHMKQSNLAYNLIYVPRGKKLEIDGKTIGFVGGAASVDKEYRVSHGWYWSQKEVVTEADIQPLIGEKLDLLITHCPPQWMIQKHFDPWVLEHYFNLPRTWRDPSADRIEELWESCGKPQLICGHMHRSVEDGNVRILNINEVLYLP